MKKLLCLSVIVLLSIKIQAQIEVTQEIINHRQTVGSNPDMSFLYVYPDSTYVLKYLDQNVKSHHQYRSIRFKDIDNTLDKLYEVMLKKIEEKDRTRTTVILPNDYLWLYYENVAFVHSVRMVHIDKFGNKGETNFSKSALDYTFSR